MSLRECLQFLLPCSSDAPAPVSNPSARQAYAQHVCCQQGGHSGKYTTSSDLTGSIHMQEKWAVINEAYQKLPFSLDTPTKKRRKEELEKQLGQLEKDIKLLQKGDRLLVVDD